MPLTVISQPLAGLLYLEPRIFGDDRGFFFESYSQRDFADLGVDIPWVQDNHSKSARGVLRGLHFQKGSNAQDKLVRCTAGRVWDVVVDLRRSSPTFKSWAGFELSAANKRLLFVPKGFAHGFISLVDGTEFLYKCSQFYDPSSEGGVIWNDPGLAINWQLGDLVPQLSARDQCWPRLTEIRPDEFFF